MAAALATAYQLPPEEPDDSREGKMSFLEHLDELRKRIIRSCLAIGIGMVIAFLFINRIRAFVFGPMLQALPAGTPLIYTKPTEAFSVNLNIALIAGVLIAAPFVMFQVWRFIAPGLYANEKKFTIPFVVVDNCRGGGRSGVQPLHRVPLHDRVLQHVQFG